MNTKIILTRCPPTPQNYTQILTPDQLTPEQACKPRQPSADCVRSFKTVSDGKIKTFNSQHQMPSKSPRLYPARAPVKLPPKPRFMSPARALLDYQGLMTQYEHKEISKYKEIYFIGKKIDKNLEKFDDDDGYYLAKTGDHLGYRYKIKETLGCGNFGQVFKCFDYKTNTDVAVKIIRKGRIFRRAGKLEVKILNELSEADPNDVNCIVKKLGDFEFRGHLCLVFELLSANLYDFLQKNDFQGLSLQLIRRISVQLFMALKTVHTVGIIHCDLKPDNILLKYENKSSIKVIDFGSACQEGNKVHEYIQSRYYRSPEVVIEAGYDKEIDIWSVGCILFELLTGRPLFPANSEQELFRMMVEVIGLPPKDFMAKGKRKHLYVDCSGELKQPIEVFSRPLRSLIENFDEQVIDLIEKCVKWKPEDRIDAEEGLSHVWVHGSKPN